MYLTNQDKNIIQDKIISKLSDFKEIQKIIIFGSFVKSNNPNDIDIAVFQNTSDDYISLSLKYRKQLRDIAKTIPVDLLPMVSNPKGYLFDEIKNGAVIYER
jgi:predicted nucleotidyltransferase